MNWQKESTEKQTLTRKGFDKLQRDIIAAIAQPEIDGDKALTILRGQFGIAGDLDFNPCFDGHVWEHPLLTQYNTRVGSRGILNAGFFTLYAKISDYEEHRYGKGEYAGVIPAHSEGYIQFVLGRVGNTFSVGRTFTITADEPEVPVADPQMDLFGVSS